MKSIFVYILLLVLLLVACKQVQPKLTTPPTDFEESLLTDEDIDAAILKLADGEELITGTKGATIVDGEEIELNDDGYVGLSTQLVLDNTEGSISYVKEVPNDTRPWELWCIDQAADKRTMIYKGNRKINSVAGNASCTIIVFSMLKQGNFEIYRLVVGNPITQLTGNNVNDIDVSQNAGANIVTWARSENGRVVYRTYSDLTNFVQTVLLDPNRQVQPSIDGNGENIALIRELTNGKDRVMLYSIATNIYTHVYTRSSDLEHPSSGNKKVAWLENGAEDKVKLKNLITGTIITVITSSEIEHPKLANDKLITYGIKENNSFDVFVKNINTGETVQGVFIFFTNTSKLLFSFIP